MVAINSKRILNEGARESFGLISEKNSGNFSIIDGSVQFIEITIGSGSTSNTQTVTAVDTSRSVIFPCGSRSDKASAIDTDVKGTLTLTNGTTVTAQRNGNGANSLTLTGYLVQFQRTIIVSNNDYENDITGTTFFVGTVNAVVQPNAFLVNRGNRSTGTTPSDSCNNLVLLSTPTSVLGLSQAISVGQTLTCAYTVLEFIPNIIEDVNVSFGGPTLIAGQTCWESSASAVTNEDHNLRMSCGNNGTFPDQGTATLQGNYLYGIKTDTTAGIVFFVESSFRMRGVKRSVEFIATIAGTNTTTNILLPEAVDINKTVIMWNGYSTGTNAGDNNADEFMKTIQLTTSTNVQITRIGTTNVANNRVCFTLVEFF